MRTIVFRLASLCIVIIPFAAWPIHRVSTLEEPGSARALRVLFIGNSLTYTNDLPSVVDAFARATGQRQFSHKTIAFPDFSLEDHWNRKDARMALIKGEWDYVVLQQGPSASREGRAVLLEYTGRFAEEIRNIRGRPALYMVWPSESRMRDFKGVSDSYREAAKSVDGLVFPVGEAWVNAWSLDPAIRLYSADGFHPSNEGSYLAGLVIYEQLFNRSPIGLPSRLRLGSGVSFEIREDTAALLQQAAKEANKKFRRP
jgi:hypothetical protein